MTKNSFPTCLLAALLLCSLAPCSATAQTEVTTVPEGYMMVTINAALATTAPKLTAFSLPLREVASASFVGQAAGRISSVTSNTIVNSAAGWAPGALSNATTPFFIRITSGAAEGRTLQISTGATAQNTATTVPDTDLRVTYNSLGGTFVAGCFPVDQTLSQLAFQQTPGWVAKTALNTIATSDKLQVFDGSAWNSYHYDAVLGQWRRGSVPINFNTTVIPAGTPVLVEKVSGSTGIGVLVRPLAYSLD